MLKQVLCKAMIAPRHSLYNENTEYVRTDVEVALCLKILPCPGRNHSRLLPVWPDGGRRGLGEHILHRGNQAGGGKWIKQNG